jgi:hypothetical protein
VPTSFNLNPNPLELATRFFTDIDGYVIGLRFYKNPNDTATTHVGTLRRADGSTIESVIFVDETSDGWQEQLFPSPIPIQAQTDYITSYFSSTGHFSGQPGFFGNNWHTGNLHGPATTSQRPNGLYREGMGAPDTPAFSQSSYFADIMFTTSL